MGKESKLIKRTAVYAVGSFGSKVLSFVLVPFYTYWLSTSDYGVYDLIATTISLLIPFVTLQINEAIIAGMLDSTKEKDLVVKSALTILGIGILVTCIFSAIAGCFFDIQYLALIVTLVCVKSVYTIIQQLCRGYGDTVLYTLSGITYTLFFLLLNIWLLSKIQLGIEALLISEIVASSLSTILILFKEPRIIGSLMQKISSQYIKWMIFFSVPMIPNAICWWGVNASDRYIINFYCGAAANGIYAISYKFAAVIQVITNLFYLSWQETSLENHGRPGQKKFISEMFNRYAAFLLSGTLVATCSTKFIVLNFMATDYSEAWKYSSWLYLGTVFSALASFLNTEFLAAGQTKVIFYGSVLAAIINVGVNIVLIPLVGVYGASFSTLIAFGVSLLYRIILCHRQYQIVVDHKKMILLSALNMVISVVILVINSVQMETLMLLLAILLFLLVNRALIMKVGKRCVAVLYKGSLK